MPIIAIKYATTGTFEGAYRKGNWLIGDQAGSYGPTSTTGFWAPIQPSGGSYVLYLPKAENGPTIYNFPTGEELLDFCNSNLGAGQSTVSEVLAWIETQNDYFVDFALPAPTVVAAAGNNSSIAFGDNKILWSWGRGNSGQLGNNSTTNRSTPVAVCGGISFSYISGGFSFNLGIDTSGKAWGWGDNGRLTLGDNQSFRANNRSTPVAVCQPAGVSFCRISGGFMTSAAIDTTGKAWGWGYNYITYAIGNPDAGLASTPVAVFGTKTYREISTGNAHTSAIDHLGKAWSWGTGSNGLLGNNSQSLSTTPVAVCQAAGVTFCKISTGVSGSHTIALDSTGKAWTWGRNTNGPLGDNTTTNRSTPVAVCQVSGVTFCQVAAGAGYSLAVDSTGRGWGWGYNGQGRVGDGSSDQRNTPVLVCQPAGVSFCLIYSNDVTSIAVDTLGRVWGWGSNYAGQIGDNSTTNRCTPVLVCRTF